MGEETGNEMGQVQVIGRRGGAGMLQAGNGGSERRGEEVVIDRRSRWEELTRKRKAGSRSKWSKEAVVGAHTVLRE